MAGELLIPTDGSVGARVGARHGLQLASEEKMRVHTLYVVDARDHGTPALSSDELFLERREEEGEAAMEEVAREAESMGLEVVRHCARGVPHEVILEYAEKNDIDVIVVGLHGDSPRRRRHTNGCAHHLEGADAQVVPV